MSEEKKYVLNGFEFATKEEYDRAKAELETITYLTTTMDMTNAKTLLKLYNKSVQKQSFHTIFGYEFLENVRKKILESKIITEKMLAPVPVRRQQPIVKRENISNRQKEQYEKKYEDAVAGSKIKNMTIVFLSIVIVAFLIITYKTKYSVFTYFTNYKAKMKNEVINEYEQWQSDLEKREKKVEQQEQQLKEQQKQQQDAQ